LTCPVICDSPITKESKEETTEEGGEKKSNMLMIIIIAILVLIIIIGGVVAALLMGDDEEEQSVSNIAPIEKGKGLNDSGDDDIKLIETKVTAFIKKTKANKKFRKSSKGQKFFKQIDKYKDKLFSDPIKVTTADGEIKLIQPQRTNNIMEQMFRKFTRDNKRKTGDDSIKRTIQGMVKDTPLIRNWQNNKFMKMMLENNKSKIDLFAEIDCKQVQSKMKSLKEVNQKIPQKIRNVLKSNQYNDKLIF
jgi:hypothetical protein